MPTIKLIDEEIETYYGPRWVYGCIDTPVNGDTTLTVNVYEGKPNLNGTLRYTASAVVDDDVLTEIRKGLNADEYTRDDVVFAVGSAAVYALAYRR